MPDMEDEIRELLQSAEDTLIENGLDEITVRTEHGVFTWVIEEEAEEVEEEGEPELE